MPELLASAGIKATIAAGAPCMLYMCAAQIKHIRSSYEVLYKALKRGDFYTPLMQGVPKAN